MSQDPQTTEQGGFYALVVDRPIAVLMVFLAVAVFGLVSYAQLPLNLMPDLSYPTLTVRTEYPGAAPEEVESQVSRPIEEALSTVDGLVSLESRSRAEVSDVVLELDWGADMSNAAQTVRERMQTTIMPDGVGRPLILRYDPSLDPILRIALSVDPDAEDAPSGNAALFLLRELAEQEVKRELEAADGVAAVRVRGGLEREVHIEVREDWLNARGVTLPQVTQTLAAENVNVAGGSIREGDTEYLLRTLNELTTLDELRGLRVIRGDGVAIPLSDLAVVRETFRDREVVSHLDGREAVELEVYKEADANIVAVADRVKALLLGDPNAGGGGPMGMKGPESLSDRLPDGVVLRVLDDQAVFIEQAVDNLASAAIQGGVLSFLMVYLFLRDRRATAIINTSVPISLVCTFAAMYVGGMSLNLMSLGGLALGVGMLVDNSVVVLEAIQVYLERGWSRRDAAIQGASEVAAAVVASTLTTLGVFFPVVFVEGVAGQIFGDLGLAVVFSVGGSLAVALIFVPMLAARDFTLDTTAIGLRGLASTMGFPAIAELRGAWSEPKRLRPLWRLYVLFRFALRLPMELFANLALGFVALLAKLFATFRLLGRPYAAAERVVVGAFWSIYGPIADSYPRWLRLALGNSGTVLGVAGLLFALSLLGTGAVGRSLIPEVHQGRFTFELRMPVGTPLDRTVSAVSQIEQDVRELPEVEAVYTAIGSERRADSRPDEGEHSARLLVQLRPGDQLEERELSTVEAIRGLITGDHGPEARLVPPALFTFRTPVEVIVHGQDLPTLRRVADAAALRLGRVDGLSDVRSSLQPGYPEVRIRYDRRQIERFGLSTAEVAQALRDKIQGAEATRMTRGEQRVDAIVRLAESDRRSVEDLGQVNINPRLDPPIPLLAVAELEVAEGPSEVRRIDQQRGAVLGANLDGLDLSSVASQVSAAMSELDWPTGYDFQLAGQTEEMQRSITSLSFALLLAIFLVYVVMASTFESLVHPLIILFTLPMAVVGVVPALLLTGTPSSVVVFIGLIVLAGVVVNNAIVLIDRINQNRREGLALDEAVMEAGRSRLRPIFITAGTTVIGLVPLALGFGAGSEIQQPLAITVIAGLSASTLLTLIVIPAMYAAIERLREAAP